MSTFSLSLNHHIDLPDDVFRLMRDEIYKRTGMWFADSSKYLLQKRLSPRARELNFDSFQKYFYFLQYDPRSDAEFDQIYDLVTTNETYFFREPAQLAAFIEEIVPESCRARASRRSASGARDVRQGRSRTRSPSSCRKRGYFERGGVRDLRQRHQSAGAREGAPRALPRERVPRHRRRRCARSTSRTRRTAHGASSDEIRNRISFGRMNLYDQARVSLLGHLDVIFCRNVIIYFDDASKQHVVSSFYNRLTDGGYLLLGHSESLISLSTQFKLRHLKNDMVYQR